MAFLDKLDTLQERFIDNAGYGPIGDDGLFQKMLTEFPDGSTIPPERPHQVIPPRPKYRGPAPGAGNGTFAVVAGRLRKGN